MANRNLVSENAREGVAVLTPHGPIVGKPDLEPFHSRVARLAKRGPISVVIDLSRQKWVGATMLGDLVRAQNMLQSAGGDLCLAAASGKTAGILNLTALGDRFATFRTVARAIASFNRNPEIRAA